MPSLARSVIIVIPLIVGAETPTRTFADLDDALHWLAQHTVRLPSPPQLPLPARHPHAGLREPAGVHTRSAAALLLLAHKTKGYGLAIMTNADQGGAVMSEISRRIQMAYEWDSMAEPVRRGYQPPVERTEIEVSTGVLAGGGTGSVVDQGGEVQRARRVR